ncbi:hypothetical protein [Kitasatospora sp. NPDC088134]|uniref:hypothetical protein n=1 Tax=Kitasatospora sp. NPDC088134 TaxID=3364071 RepID=UPI00382F309F
MAWAMIPWLGNEEGPVGQIGQGGAGRRIRASRVGSVMMRMAMIQPSVTVKAMGESGLPIRAPGHLPGEAVDQHLSAPGDFAGERPGASGDFGGTEDNHRAARGVDGEAYVRVEDA